MREQKTVIALLNSFVQQINDVPMKITTSNIFVAFLMRYRGEKSQNINTI